MYQSKRVQVLGPLKFSFSTDPLMVHLLVVGHWPLHLIPSEIAGNL